VNLKRLAQHWRLSHRLNHCQRGTNSLLGICLLEQFQPVRAQERFDMAKALVNSLAAEWDPEKYTDQYLENLMRIIKGKAKGKKVTLEAGETPRKGEVVDLMERLRRSLDQAGGTGRAKKAVAKKATAKKRTRAA
jgi:DNA end-binding protein Ku